MARRRNARLTAAQRRAIPSSKFGLPSTRQYPIEDVLHAIDAKGRALQQLERGNLTPSQYRQIVRRADTVEYNPRKRRRRRNPYLLKRRFDDDKPRIIYDELSPTGYRDLQTGRPVEPPAYLRPEPFGRTNDVAFGRINNPIDDKSMREIIRFHGWKLMKNDDGDIIVDTEDAEIIILHQNDDGSYWWEIRDIVFKDVVEEDWDGQDRDDAFRQAYRTWKLRQNPGRSRRRRRRRNPDLEKSAVKDFESFADYFADPPNPELMYWDAFEKGYGAAIGGLSDRANPYGPTAAGGAWLDGYDAARAEFQMYQAGVAGETQQQVIEDMLLNPARNPLGTTTARLGNLPTEYKQMWISVYDEALMEYNDEALAARTAWAAVKKDCEKIGNTWVCKNPKKSKTPKAIKGKTKNPKKKKKSKKKS